MRIVVIGGTGHVGGYLIPRLVACEHDVTVVSRGIREPYRADPAWDQVRRISIDRQQAEADGSFGEAIAALRPDAVIDMVCFTADSARHLIDALRPGGSRLVTCGSIWIHGQLTEVPGTEDAPLNTWGEYGLGKIAVEAVLTAESARADGVRCVVLHPGHISGPGWPVINPLGMLDLDVWERLATGREVVMPHQGLETLNHVHADDVAQAFLLAIDRADALAGQSFNVVASRALTLRGYAEAVAAWFGRRAQLRFVPFDEFRAAVGDVNADIAWDHIVRSHAFSIEKAQRLLGYSPRFSSLEAIAEAVAWLQRDGRLRLDGRPFTAHLRATE